jgi:ankyrin repeat protein
MKRTPTQSEIQNPNISKLSEFTEEGLHDILIYAIQHHNNGMVKTLLDYGANPNFNNDANGSFLMIMDKFIEDATVDKTPIEFAIRYNNPIAMKHLLDYGGIVVNSSPFLVHRSPILKLCRTKNFECLAPFIETMEHIDMPIGNTWGKSLVGISIEYRNKDLYDFLVGLGANPYGNTFSNGRYIKNKNVFNVIFRTNYDVDQIIDMLEFLQSRDISIHGLPDHFHYPYEQVMSSKHSLKLLQYMISKGVDIEKNNHHAILSSIGIADEETLQFIIEQSKNLNVKSNHNKTPIDIALYHKRLDLVKVFLELGVDYSYDDMIKLAVEDKSNEIIDLFFNHELKKDGLTSLWGL